MGVVGLADFQGLTNSDTLHSKVREMTGIVKERHHVLAQTPREVFLPGVATHQARDSPFKTMVAKEDVENLTRAPPLFNLQG